MGDESGKKNIESSWDENKLVALAEAASKLGFTPEYLNLLCRQKRMKGKKLGRNWFTTKEWADEYFNEKAREAKKERGVWVSIVKDKEKERNSQSLIESLKAEDFKREEVAKRIERGDEVNRLKMIERKEGTEKASVGSVKDEKKTIARKMFFALNYSTIFLGVAVFIISIISGSIYLQFLNRPLDLENNYGSEILEQEGFVKGEQTQDISGTNVAFASENYQASEINIGGDVLIADNEENNPMKIFDLDSESYSTKNNGDFRLLVKWKTNKLAKSEVDYAKQNSQDKTTLTEEGYGYNHMAILSKLEFSNAYIYKIKSTDKWGNVIESDDFGFYTGSKEVSVFEMISEAVGEVFGWAIK
jgi:hypothetical protein